jgi:dissimilatory sulfite reductase (desulfoviridin) alpha/beta subunit
MTPVSDSASLFCCVWFCPQAVHPEIQQQVFDELAAAGLAFAGKDPHWASHAITATQANKHCKKAAVGAAHMLRTEAAPH